MQTCPQCGYSEKPSTNQQRRAWFGIGVKMLAYHLGYDKEDMYKVLAGEFFGYTEVILKGKVHLIPKSTRGHSTKIFKEFMEFTQRIGAENGIIINDPDPCPRDNP